MNQACCNCAPKLHVFGSEIHYIRIKVLESFFTIEWCCHYNYYNYDLNKDISFWNSSLSNGLDPAVKRLKLKLQVMTSRGMCFSYCLMRAVMLIKVTVQVTWSSSRTLGNNYTGFAKFSNSTLGSYVCASSSQGQGYGQHNEQLTWVHVDWTENRSGVSCVSRALTWRWHQEYLITTKEQQYCTEN